MLPVCAERKPGVFIQGICRIRARAALGCRRSLVQSDDGRIVVYFRDKVIGGIYDDRFLVKPTPAVVSLLAGAEYQIPYEGAKEMLLVDAIENRELMAQLLQAMYPELPERKPRKKK